jgi:hypothetical protein
MPSPIKNWPETSSRPEKSGQKDSDINSYTSSLNAIFLSVVLSGFGLAALIGYQSSHPSQVQKHTPQAEISQKIEQRSTAPAGKPVCPPKYNCF